LLLLVIDSDGRAFFIAYPKASPCRFTVIAYPLLNFLLILLVRGGLDFLGAVQGGRIATTAIILI
jgi:hypothetical protein